MEILISMVLFSISMSLTPGPVNLLALSVGITNGFKRSLIFVSGATLGFTALLVSVGIILQQTITFLPVLVQIIAVFGALYLGYIGYYFFVHKDNLTPNTQQGKLGFGHGWLMQWLNPKAWLASVSGNTLFSFTDGGIWFEYFIGIYFVICYLSIMCWALAGNALMQWLNKPRYGQWFNQILGVSLMIMAISLLASVADLHSIIN